MGSGDESEALVCNTGESEETMEIYTGPWKRLCRLRRSLHSCVSLLISVTLVTSPREYSTRHKT